MTQCAITLAALQAQAETAPAAAAGAVVVAHADANGSFPFDEAHLASRKLTEEHFETAETDANGTLSVDERKAAEEAKIFENEQN